MREPAVNRPAKGDGTTDTSAAPPGTGHDRRSTPAVPPGAVDPALKAFWQDCLDAGLWVRGRHVTGDDLIKQCHGLRLLYLFSGPTREDGVDSVCRLLRSEATMLDLDQPDRTDLADSLTWDSVERKLNTQ